MSIVLAALLVASDGWWLRPEYEGLPADWEPNVRVVWLEQKRTRTPSGRDVAGYALVPRQPGAACLMVLTTGGAPREMRWRLFDHEYRHCKGWRHGELR